MFKTIAIVAVVLIAALLIYAATKPDTFRVQRSASIEAPPEKDLSPRQRPAQSCHLVAVGEKRPHDEKDTQRRCKRQGRRV